MDDLEFYFNNTNFPERNLIRRKSILTSFSLKSGSNILDVGAFGICSEDEVGFNTSIMILDHYTHCNIDGINLDNSYLKNPRHTEMNMIQNDFFSHKYEKKYDLIICDLYFHPLRRFWQSNCLDTLIKDILNPGGYFLIWFHRNLNILERHWYLDHNATDYANFIMNFWQIDQPKLTIRRMQEILPLRISEDWQVISCHEEAERSYINWSILQFKDYPV